MNTTPQSAAELARGIVDGTAGIAGVTTIICPPFVSLQAVKSVVDGIRRFGRRAERER